MFNKSLKTDMDLLIVKKGYFTIDQKYMEVLSYLDLVWIIHYWNCFYSPAYYQTDAVVEAESGTHCITSMADVMIDIPDLKKDLAPAETDFLIAHSTTQGYVSYRFKSGSLYIQTLVDSLREYSPRWIFINHAYFL